MSRIIFGLGLKVKNVFSKTRTGISFSNYIFGILLIIIIYVCPVIVIIFSESIAIEIDDFINSSIDVVDIRIFIMFLMLFLVLLVNLIYRLSKIKYINESSIISEYTVEGVTHVSNINGKIKKHVIKKIDEDSFGLNEILLDSVPFRRLVEGSILKIIYRDDSRKDLYYIEGEKRLLYIGYSTFVLLSAFIFTILIML